MPASAFSATDLLTTGGTLSGLRQGRGYLQVGGLRGRRLQGQTARGLGLRHCWSLTEGRGRILRDHMLEDRSSRQPRYGPLLPFCWSHGLLSWQQNLSLSAVRCLLPCIISRQLISVPLLASIPSTLKLVGWPSLAAGLAHHFCLYSKLQNVENSVPQWDRGLWGLTDVPSAGCMGILPAAASLP